MCDLRWRGDAHRRLSKMRQASRSDLIPEPITCSLSSPTPTVGIQDIELLQHIESLVCVRRNSGIPYPSWITHYPTKGRNSFPWVCLDRLHVGHFYSPNGVVLQNTVRDVAHTKCTYNSQASLDSVLVYPISSFSSNSTALLPKFTL